MSYKRTSQLSELGSTSVDSFHGVARCVLDVAVGLEGGLANLRSSNSFGSEAAAVVGRRILNYLEQLACMLKKVAVVSF